MDFHGGLYFIDECCPFHITFQVNSMLDLETTFPYRSTHQWRIARNA